MTELWFKEIIDESFDVGQQRGKVITFHPQEIKDILLNNRAEFHLFCY